MANVLMFGYLLRFGVKIHHRQKWWDKFYFVDRKKLKPFNFLGVFLSLFIAFLWIFGGGFLSVFCCVFVKFLLLDFASFATLLPLNPRCSVHKCMLLGKKTQTASWMGREWEVQVNHKKQRHSATKSWQTQQESDNSQKSWHKVTTIVRKIMAK